MHSELELMHFILTLYKELEHWSGNEAAQELARVLDNEIQMKMTAWIPSPTELPLFDERTPHSLICQAIPFF